MNAKALLSLLLAVLACATAAAKGTFRPGQLWPDNRGKHINAHGGGIVYHRGTYYWFGEHKSDSTSSALVGVT